MSARIDPVAQRRTELLDRIEQDREAVAEAFATIRRRTQLAETVLGTAKRAGRHRVLTGFLAVAAILAPLAARSWLKRAAWILPLVLEAIRVVRRRRDDDRDPPS